MESGNWELGDGVDGRERNGHETRIEKFLVVLMLMLVDLGRRVWHGGIVELNSLSVKRACYHSLAFLCP